MLANVIATTLRFRWWVIIVSLVFVTSTFMGLERIPILSDYKSFLDPEYPGLIEQEKVEAIFTENNRLMIAVEPQDQQVFKPATIRLIQVLTNGAWMLPYVSRVDSISNYQHTEAAGDDLNVGSLLPDDAPLSQALMDRASRISASGPLLKDNLVSAKQNVGVISMTFDFIVASVAGVCLGVVVDFAVHFLSKYQRKRKAGQSTENAIIRTFEKTGRPLWTTMIVLVAGFWLLMLSPVTLNFSMGCLTGIVIMLALAFDFVALPCLWFSIMTKLKVLKTTK